MYSPATIGESFAITADRDLSVTSREDFVPRVLTELNVNIDHGPDPYAEANQRTVNEFEDEQAETREVPVHASRRFHFVLGAAGHLVCLARIDESPPVGLSCRFSNHF
jgi:hypothetical protein